MGHESYDRREDIHAPSNRAFGLVFAVVFAIVGVLPLFFGHSMHAWAFVVAAAFLLAALARPSILKPLNALWLKFGLLLHRIVSPLVLGLMFFLVVTPTGIVMRLVGKDPLRLKWDARLPSYWVDRKPPGPAPESLRDQF